LSKDVIKKWDSTLGQIMKSKKFIDLLKKLKVTQSYENFY